MKKSHLQAFLLMIFIFTIGQLSGQYAVQSPYLLQPERNAGYVDSCATFWLGAFDPVHGGFYTNIDRQGNLIASWGRNKNMLTQSRNAYGFVRAYQMTGNILYLQQAREALDFMYGSAWDNTNGGWFSEINENGTPRGTTNDKSAFDQHYALLGISAYYEATGDTVDWNWLMRGYNHNETYLWDDDPVNFGYYDYGIYTWNTVNWKSFNATVDAITTHLLSLYLITEDPVYLTRLEALADNILTHMVGSMSGQAIGMVEEFNSSWQWRNSETLTIMGHILKAGWCLGRVNQLAPNNNYVDGAHTLIDEVWTMGYDHDFGGPYKDYRRDTGEMEMWGNPDTAKAWWQMEQAVTAGLELYRITGEDWYLEMADETLLFFMRHFVDHTYGEVYENRTRYGAETWGTHKGNGFKAAYHSIELGYYTYLYGSLFYKQEPVLLHYQFESYDHDRDIILTPLAISDGQLRIAAVRLEGQPYLDVDPQSRVLHLPAGDRRPF